MAKTIKFNLILNEKPVRDLEDLKNNFAIEDVLEVYNNGLLKKWLKVREYDEYLEKIESIKRDDDADQIRELIKIFEIESDDNTIKQGLAILDYINERKSLLDEYKKAHYQTKKIINDYHAGYDSLIWDTIENKDNMPKIKANMREIEENYMGLFALNYRDLYYNLIDYAPLAVFAILMNTTMRKYFISGENSNSNTNEVYGKLKALLATKSLLKGKLGEELKVCKRNTGSYWSDIETKEKTFMLISMETGDLVRNVAKTGEELSSIEVNNKFLLLNGIDYKSNSDKRELLYMEV